MLDREQNDQKYRSDPSEFEYMIIDLPESECRIQQTVEKKQ